MRSPTSSSPAKWCSRGSGQPIDVARRPRSIAREESRTMRIEVKVPQLPESVAEATLVNWHKKAGEAVKRDENLIDIETDKVVLELPAPGDGVLVEITRPDGSTVTSNDVIAVIDTDGKADGAATSTAAVAPTAAPAAAPLAASATALPAARKMMADQGVDPSTVTGTGRGGRILKEDVAQTVAAGAGHRGRVDALIRHH